MKALNVIAWIALVFNGLSLVGRAVAGLDPTWWTVLSGAGFAALFVQLVPRPSRRRVSEDARKEKKA